MMRRNDREVTDIAKISDIISKCHCCRLGFYDAGKVYIVPLNFGYEETNGTWIFYFHGAAEGRKIDLIKQTHHAGFDPRAEKPVYAVTSVRNSDEVYRIVPYNFYSLPCCPYYI